MTHQDDNAEQTPRTGFPTPSSTVFNVQRDVFRSALAGPLRFIVPVAGYFILYPLMLDRAGLAVLGLWSLLSTLTSYLGMADVGFSLLITREAGRDRSEGEATQCRRDYLAAKRVYAAVAAVVLGTLLFAGEGLFLGLSEYYSPGDLLLATMVLVVGATLQITARLDAAVLAARNDNYGVQLVLAITPVFPFAASVAGTLLGAPIEGLAVGALLSGLSQIVIFRHRLRRHHPQWGAEAVALSSLETLLHLRSLMRRGWHLYIISVGFILREPVFRLVLGVGLGPQAVGIYDIAMRVTRTIRDMAASGFTALLPGLAVLHRGDERKATIELLRVSLLALVAAGTTGFVLLLLFAAEVYSLWLGELPGGLVVATHLLVIGNLISLANVPFWYLLQASGNERFGARALWLQTAAVLALVPAGAFLDFTAPGMLAYWVATEFVMLVSIYWFSQSRLHVFFPVVNVSRVLLLATVAVGFIAAAWSMAILSVDTAQRIVLGVGCLGLLFIIVWDPVREFIAVTKHPETKPPRRGSSHG
ncbi:MAG: lipopolysaccharide biosynthesis protein [Alphaproteobacteria bacterium]|nr:lipopolysaccharide biosynthesis protein [Alphaproteobacteria bacterium]